MARALFQSQSGTQDIFPAEASRRRRLLEIFAEEVGSAGYGQIIPPMFEDVGVFLRLGEASDVVSKELYNFVDQGGRNLALRPEFTASVCRVFAQHRPLVPWKVWYTGSSFRQERPQKGRYRQFDQIGAEVIGTDDPDVDIELIALCWRFYQRVGLRDVSLAINSLGDLEDRARYLEDLKAYFQANAENLSEQALKTAELNPLRVLDSKRPADAEVVAKAPLLADYLGEDASASFERVEQGLTTLGIPFEVAPRLVRGLDYYGRTIFEFAATSLDAAQNAVGGGGRYDGLVADLGGGAQPGVGFALGVDRILLACDAEGVFEAIDDAPQIWVVATTPGTEALEITQELQAAGLRAGRSFGGRSMKAQMKAANKSGADIAVIVGESEAEAASVSIRPLRTNPPSDGAETGRSDPGVEQVVIERTAMIKKVRSLLS